MIILVSEPSERRPTPEIDRRPSVAADFRERLDLSKLPDKDSNLEPSG